MDFLKSFAHPEEVMALLCFKFGGREVLKSKCEFNNMSPSLRECYDLLNKTSRSFAAVIQALEGELRDTICIYYLILRALDTIEDDMTIPNNVKVPMLKNFYKNLEDPDWRYMESKDKDRIVLESFPIVIDKIPEADPSASKTHAVCQKILEVTETQQEYSTSTIYSPLCVSLGLMLIAIAYTYWSQILELYDDLL